MTTGAGAGGALSSGSASTVAGSDSAGTGSAAGAVATLDAQQADVYGCLLMTLDQSTVEGSGAIFGGGIVLGWGGTLHLIDSAIADNKADDSGGGILVFRSPDGTLDAGSTALVVRRDGLLAGYGVIRPCRIGCKIGPLFADDADLADRLLRALVSRVRPGEPVQLDVPATNPLALELAQSHGMRPVFETARMYAGVAPDLPIRRMFGITSFELG